MSLQYPLKNYDEAGRMKPPLVVYLVLFFVCRGLLVLIVSLSFREDSERLLRIFYPQPYHFYLSLVPILPAILALYLVSYRNRLWEKKRFSLFKWLPVLVIASAILDASMQTYMLWKIDFRYSISHGVSLIIAAACVIYVLRSQYVRSLVKDWQAP